MTLNYGDRFYFQILLDLKLLKGQLKTHTLQNSKFRMQKSFISQKPKLKIMPLHKKFSIKSSLSKPQLSADLVTFTEENLNGNFNVCAVLHSKMFRSRTDRQNFLNINSDHPKLLRKQNHTQPVTKSLTCSIKNDVDHHQIKIENRNPLLLTYNRVTLVDLYLNLREIFLEQLIFLALPVKGNTLFI